MTTSLKIGQGDYGEVSVSSNMRNILNRAHHQGYSGTCIDVEGLMEWTHSGCQEIEDDWRCVSIRTDGELPPRVHATSVSQMTIMLLSCDDF